MKFRKALAAAGIVAAVVVTAPVVHAETRLALNGARPRPALLNAISSGGLTPAEYAALTPQIGANWLPGTSPVVVDYPATAGPLWGRDAPTADQSTATGQANLHAAIMTATANGEPVVVAGLSEGTIVIDRELAYLATDASAPPANQLTFVLFASPSRGVASLLAPGTYIPVLGYTTRSIPQSQYNTDVVFAEFDGWADFPDRPWYLIADANAIMGAGYLHTPTALADRSRAVVVSSTTNSKGGTTTTYMTPTQRLPLTDPLRRAGVPTSVTDKIDEVLRPVVDAGYSRNDTGPIPAPYLSQGRLVVPSPPKREAPRSAGSSSDLPRTKPLAVALSKPNVSAPKREAPRSAGSSSDLPRTKPLAVFPPKPKAPLSKKDATPTRHSLSALPRPNPVRSASPSGTMTTPSASPRTTSPGATATPPAATVRPRRPCPTCRGRAG
jgi:PE-PPE domain